MMRTILTLAFAAAIFNVTGCGNSDGDKKKETTANKVKTVTVSAELEERLAAADAVDGQNDQTISKCYCCGLGMAGKPEHSVEVNGYIAHFCAERCSTYFEEKADEVISDTKIPKTQSETTDQSPTSKEDDKG